MIGWHDQLYGHEFEQALGVGDGQGSLMCCSPWGCKSRTQVSNWTELNSSFQRNTDLSLSLLLNDIEGGIVLQLECGFSLCVYASSSTLATSHKELTHWKRLWFWEGLGTGREGVNRGWDGWMASPTRWMWVWVNSRRWWWTGRPGVLWFMGSQRVGHDWETELNWGIKEGIA